MRVKFWVALLVIVLFTGSVADVFACGDKYLAVGRGARFQRGYVSLHPVSVVVLRSGVTGTKNFLSRLKLAGHRVTTTDDVAKLGELLTHGKYEVVLADYQNASEVESMLIEQKAKAVFLPVVERKENLTASDAKKYGCVLNAATSKKRKHFLAVLDEAVDARLKAQPVVCNFTGM